MSYAGSATFDLLIRGSPRRSIHGLHDHRLRRRPPEDKVRAVKIIERDDDAEHGGEWSRSMASSMYGVVLL